MSSRRLIGFVLGRGRHPTKVHRIASQQIAAPMSALGQKRTSRLVEGMSALPPKADIGIEPRNVRFVPIADIRPEFSRGSALGLVHAKINGPHGRLLRQKRRTAKWTRFPIRALFILGSATTSAT